MGAKVRFRTGMGAVAALLSLSGAPVAAQPAPNGEQLFRQRCAMCHVNAAGKPATLGPNLSGVVGRKAGSTAYAYSAALKASKITWTSANLDRYLSGPARMVPGTRMAVVLSDPAQRGALIKYLSSAR
ncbi:MAG TPA: c-type cytochrome [Sphingobium sp.]